MSFNTLHAQMGTCGSHGNHPFLLLSVTALQHSKGDRHKNRFLKAQTVFGFASVCSPIPLFLFFKAKKPAGPPTPKKTLGTVEGISVPEVTVQVRGPSCRQI